MKTKLIIGMFAAMWICAACEKVEIINESDREESEGMKEIVMHVGGIAWSYEDSGICDAPSYGSRRNAAARDAATRALEANGEAMKELWARWYANKRKLMITLGA